MPKFISPALSLTILFCSLFFKVPLAFCEIHRAESLEWLAVDSDLIVRGTVTDVKKTTVPTEEFPNLPMEDVTLQIDEVLKGKYTESTLSFKRFNYYNPSEGSADRWKDSNSEFLFFLSKGKLSPNSPEVNLDLKNQLVIRADYPYGPIDLNSPKKFALYIVSADMKSPNEGKQILQIIRDRVENKRNVNASQFQEVSNAMNIPLGAKILEAPDDSEAFKNLYGGSSVEVVVPEN